MSNDAITPAQVKAARALLAWSQQELAAAARVSQSTVADFERAARTPVPNNAMAIREALEGKGIQFTAGGVVLAGAATAGPARRPGTVMRWISASDLVAWAARNDGGKAKFPELISRLIYAEKGPAARLSFPSDDSTHYHGWDGQCWVAEGTAFIPAGQSGWELGAQRDGLKGKADDDYEIRTLDPQGLDRATTTFVFATLQRWAPKGRWEADKRKDGRWANVRALDADDLVHWLETAPAVAQWLAQQIGRRPEGLTDLAEAWREWSLATDPALTEDLLLTDREDDATVVHKWLQGDPASWRSRRKRAGGRGLSPRRRLPVSCALAAPRTRAGVWWSAAKRAGARPDQPGVPPDRRTRCDGRTRIGGTSGRSRPSCLLRLRPGRRPTDARPQTGAAVALPS